MLSKSSKAIWDKMATASAAHGENNDCTVKALTAATGLTYDECHAALKTAGRKNRRGCHMHREGVAAATALGFHMTRLGPHQYNAKTMITAERDRNLKKGRFVLRVRGHVAALIDGKVIDWSQGRRHRINAVYAVTPMATKPEPKKAPTRRRIPKGSADWQAFKKYKKADNLELF